MAASILLGVAIGLLLAWLCFHRPNPSGYDPDDGGGWR